MPAGQLHTPGAGVVIPQGGLDQYLASIDRGERNLTLDSVDALAELLDVEARTLLTRL
ncbi:hypothetical protein [Rhodococcus sp. KB6]|uniref:hypothetical protein n=1 Tax=Rhodococcus sp. KB6 TaxID=1752066 RepID=UPI001C12A587|nr:hypothetical protein [Rhodococcus sp. KB6]